MQDEPAGLKLNSTIITRNRRTKAQIAAENARRDSPLGERGSLSRIVRACVDGMRQDKHFTASEIAQLICGNENPRVVRNVGCALARMINSGDPRLKRKSRGDYRRLRNKKAADEQRPLPFPPFPEVKPEVEDVKPEANPTPITAPAPSAEPTSLVELSAQVQEKRLRNEQIRCEKEQKLLAENARLDSEYQALQGL